MNQRPHLIKLSLAPNRLGHWDGAIAAFHDEREIAMRFRHRSHRKGRVTLCFANAADADAFHERFGGTRIGRRARGARHRAAAMMSARQWAVAMICSGQLILKRTSTSRPSGQWNDDDFDVLADDIVVGRIMKAAAAPVGSPWLWTYGFDPRERQPAHGYAATRAEAMAAFAKSWRQK